MPGSDPEAVKKRRTIARWLVLTAALAWRDVSIIVRKRFPTLRHLVGAGLMTEDELTIYDQIQTPAAKWFLPLHWVQRATESEIKERQAPAPITAGFLAQLNHYRSGFRSLYCYDWVCIPLVYTQVLYKKCTVRSFFVAKFCEKFYFFEIVFYFRNFIF